MNQSKLFILFLCFGFSCSIAKVSAQSKDTSFFYTFDLDDLFGKKKELISLGTRTAGRTETDSPVPVDILSAEEITGSSQVELSQILTYLLPSFNANYQTISDGTDHIVPASFRGLGPDQILVFINGKRRHSSSLVNVNGTFGRGSVSTDFDAIPVAAIERIEILRDGASAQYGSDAIAGVINIVMKEDIGLSASSTMGRMKAGDGQRYRYDVNYGTKIGTKGFCNITGEVVDRGATNRAGLYNAKIYPDNMPSDMQDSLSQLFDLKTMKIGNADSQTGKLFYNLSMPLRGQAELYVFGGISFRQSRAAGFYRFPKDTAKVVEDFYENGFLPEIKAQITDNSICMGLKQTFNQWLVDFSAIYGRNNFDFNVENSNNSSLGSASPVEFYCGGFSFGQITANFDVSRKLNNVRSINSMNVAMGGEFRLDNFAIIAGEEASYILGNDPTGLPGSQVFSGFDPLNQLNENRFSTSFYVDFEFDVNTKLLVEAAGNFVNYSDWGNNLIGKLAIRYKAAPFLTFRGGISSGFRSSSLHQSYSTNVSTQFIDGESFQVGTFNGKTLVIQKLGIPELKEENSINYSMGIVSHPLKNLTITADLYRIDIFNRIVLSGQLSADEAKIKPVLEPFGVKLAQFFTNAVDTRTMGGDIMALYKQPLGNKLHHLYFSCALNYSKTSIVGNVKTSQLLHGEEEVLFNREERSRIESGTPANKVILSLQYKGKKLWAKGQAIRFGEVTYVHPKNVAQDQVFSPKWVTDITLGYQLTKLLKCEIGANNIFDVYPDRLKNPSNTDNGQFVYSRRVTQFGFNGAYYFMRIALTL